MVNLEFVVSKLNAAVFVRPVENLTALDPEKETKNLPLETMAYAAVLVTVPPPPDDAVGALTNSVAAVVYVTLFVA